MLMEKENVRFYFLRKDTPILVRDVSCLDACKCSNVLYMKSKTWNCILKGIELKIKGIYFSNKEIKEFIAQKKKKLKIENK